MKMYILVKEDVPVGYAMVAVVHASLAAYLKFADSKEVKEWLTGPFYKTICKVNEKQFEKAKIYEDCIVITESSLNNKEIAIAFKPRKEWPKDFKFFPLYK